MTTMVDVNVPRFNQALVTVLTALAFLLDAPWLVAITAAILAVSYVGGAGLAVFPQLYVRALRPRLDPDGPSELEPAAPPRFAQLLGALFLTAASVAFSVGLTAAGWGLTLVVTALAALAATTRICVGCLPYAQAIA